MRITVPWSKSAKSKEPVEIDLEELKATYTTESTSDVSMEFCPIKLHRRETAESERSRKILAATGIKNCHDPRHCLKIRLMYQRKHNKGTVPEGEEFRNLKRIRLSDLSAGQEIQVDLDSAQTAQLAEHIQNLYAVASEGIEYGTAEKAVVRAADAELLETLIQDLQGSPERRDEVLRMIRGQYPVAFEAAAVQARHERHSAAVQEFEDHLDAKDWDEGDWEEFFKKNRWIFGHGLAYQFLTEIQDQPQYGGTALSGRGGQRGDHLMATEATCRFTVLVEIKTPQAVLAKEDVYRSGAHVLGKDVVGGVSQLQVNIRKWTIQGSQQEENRSLEAENVYTVQPKGILVVGNTASLDSLDKRNTFELFRQGLHNPEIITFDEVCSRAKLMVQCELRSDNEETEPDS